MTMTGQQERHISRIPDIPVCIIVPNLFAEARTGPTATPWGSSRFIAVGSLRS